jgi:hypothetical protein
MAARIGANPEAVVPAEPGSQRVASGRSVTGTAGKGES